MGNTIFRSMLFVGMLVALDAGVLDARSSVTDVTPENVTDQPLVIRVESEERSNGAISFTVFVSAGEWDISPQHVGRFEIAGIPLVKSNEKFRPLPTPVVWCNVGEVVKDGELRYNFGVPRESLQKASFTFRNFVRGAPAFNGFRVLLKEFAPKE